MVASIDVQDLPRDLARFVGEQKRAGIRDIRSFRQSPDRKTLRRSRSVVRPPEIPRA